MAKVRIYETCKCGSVLELELRGALIRDFDIGVAEIWVKQHLHCYGLQEKKDG